MSGFSRLNNNSNINSTNNGVSPNKRNLFGSATAANTSTNINNNNNNSNINSSIIKQELLEEQKLEIREAFQLFDMNGDGCLDYH